MPFFGLFGPPDVEKMKTKGNVQGLIKALGYEKDVNVRRAAAEALGQKGDTRAVGPLVGALKDKDRNVREAASRALGQIGIAAIEPLVAALKDQDSAVRQAAIEALRQIGDVRTVEPLMAALKDKDRNVREAASRALGQIGIAAIEPLVAALKDQDSAVRRAAIEALKRIRDVRTVEPLVAVLKDQDSVVRQAAAWALEALGWQPTDVSQRALQAVALHRWEQAAKLGAVAAELLAAVLQDGTDKECWGAAQALAQIGDARAVRPLVTFMT